MTDVKQLPENLEQLEQLTEFKRVYKKQTVDQIEEQLIEKDVEFLSADNKAELVWRLLDAQGFDFEGAQSELASQEKLAGDSFVEADESVKTAQDANNGEQPNETADASDSDTPSDMADNNDIHANENEQPAKKLDQSTANSTVPNHETLSTQAIEQDGQVGKPAGENEVEANHIAVHNTGAFAFFETATSTLVPAKETTKIYPTPTADKDRIIRNIKQYNHTRGNKLRIID